MAALAVAVPAQAALYGVQPATGTIVQVDPATGAVTGSFDAPGELLAGDTRIGLSGAEGGTTLIYLNDTVSASSPLYRLHPATGAVLSTELADDATNDGLSFQTGLDSRKLIFTSHSATDIHRQSGFGSIADESGWATGSPVGGLAGDDFGREFGFFTDGNLHEYDPLADTDSFISTLPAPASNIQGLAFDGTVLYAATASGTLYTISTTGQVLNAVQVSGGALYGLGVALGAPPPPPPPPPPAAGGVLYGAQPATGNIVQVDPSTGAVTRSFDAPGDLLAGETRIGLSGAEEGTTLIYLNDTASASTPLHRLDPITGAVLSTEVADDATNDGLSFQTAQDFRNLIFSSHSATDIHRQRSFSGPDDSNWATGSPVGGLAGDDFGREFGFFTDGNLHEYDPLTDTNGSISTLPAPASDIQGLAFNGSALYASTASGNLHTVDAANGAVLNTVQVSGGALYGLGVARGPSASPCALPPTHTGSPAANTLTGTPAADHMLGLAGSDTINGLGGNDCLEGGTDQDTLRGGEGDDTLLGGDGQDVLDPGAGTDTVDAGAGGDRVEAAGGGSDTVTCGPGSDLARIDATDTLAPGHGCETVQVR